MAVDRRTKEKEIQSEQPLSIDAEQQVLGSILKDTDVLNAVIDYIKDPGYFYVPKHQIIYKAMLSLYEKGEVCDITTVSEELIRMGEIEKIGGRYYLVELAARIASTAHIESHLKIMVDKATLRNLIRTSTDIISSCYSLDYDVADLLDKAEVGIFSIGESRLRSGFMALHELLPKTFEQIEEFQDAKGGIIGIETGFVDLDTMIGGLHNGDFIVIAGRPSMGKTAFALNIAEYISIEKNIPVGIFSIEMSKEQLALRLLCSSACLSQHKVRTGKLHDDEYQSLTRAVGPLGEANIYIDDSGTLTTMEMRGKARRLKAQHDVGLIIVDYIQMMHTSSRAENRQQEMAMISRAFKSLAKELNIPIVGISQLSRMVESREGRRPQLSDLRESGAIEQDADVVIFVYREVLYMKEDNPAYADKKYDADIIVAKQRNGPTGTVKLSFMSDWIRFVDQEQMRRPAPEAESDIPF